MVEKNNKEELNELIKNILLQDVQFKTFHQQMLTEIKNITLDIEKQLLSYLEVRKKLIETTKRNKDIGTSVSIKQGLEKLEGDLVKGQTVSFFSADEVESYNELILEQSRLVKLLHEIEQKKEVLKKIENEILLTRNNLMGIEGQFPVKGEIDRILDELTEVTPDMLGIKAGIDLDLQSVSNNLALEISKLNLDSQSNDANILYNAVNEKLSPYLAKLNEQKELQQLSISIEKEKRKLEEANNLEKQKNVLSEDYTNLRRKIAALLIERNSKYFAIVENINITKREIGAGITLDANVIYKLEKFNLHSQVNKAAITNTHYFNTLFSANDAKVYFQRLPALFSQFLRVHNDKLLMDGDESIPLKVNTNLEEVLQGLIADNLEIDYTVTYKGDDLLSMSPGKKGTVLLILFIQISSAEYPILIDQPEDNLDNRTIYDLLCTMIKTKKSERQIIIVSHNANLVVATDAENIIVANQKGQSATTRDGKTRFEYVNGSIEHSYSTSVPNESILYQQGIKEHVTDILEGGDEAFKKRELKYAIK